MYLYGNSTVLFCDSFSACNEKQCTAAHGCSLIMFRIYFNVGLLGLWERHVPVDHLQMSETKSINSSAAERHKN